MITGIETIKLNQIGRFINGANFGPKQLGYGTKFVNLDDIYREKDLKSSDYFEKVFIKNEENYILEDGDILFVRSSVKPSGVGYPCLFIKDSTDPVIFCGFIIRYRFDQNIVFPKYLLYQLLLPCNRNKVISRGQVGANTNINQRGLGSLYINIHSSLSEQKAIAGILSKVDEAIEVVENSIKAAESLKKSLMQNLLTGKLKTDGTWRSEDEFIDTRIGLIPKEWRLFKAKDLCLKVTDGTHDTPSPSQEGYPLVTSKNLKNNGVDFDGCYLVSRADYVEINKRSKVNQYDILFGMIGTVGNPQIVIQNPVEFAIKNVGLFKTNGDKELSIWIKNYLSSNMFEIYKYKQQAGTTQQFVSLGFLRKIPIPLPYNNDEIDYKQVQEINSKINSIEDILLEKEKKLNSLKNLKKSLMQNLLTGKVRVDVEKINKLLEVE